MKTHKQLIKRRREIGGPLNDSALNSAYLRAYEGAVLGASMAEIERRTISAMDAFDPDFEADKSARIAAARAGQEQAMTDLMESGLAS